MLEILNMTEEELLFNFMDNLQHRVEQELRRRVIQDLATTMAAESLVEYKKEDFSKPKPQSKGNHAKDWGRGGDKGAKGYTVTKEGPRKGPNGKDGKNKDKRKEFTR